MMTQIILNPVFILGWVIFSLISGIMGSNKRLGFWGTFLASLIVSPVITIIFMHIFQPKKHRI